MTVSLIGNPRDGLAIYRRRPGKATARHDRGPLVAPLSNMDRLLFHTQLGYVRVTAYQPPIAVALPARTGSGEVVWLPPGWPGTHKGGADATGILLVGSTTRNATQQVLGDVTPKGYSGKGGARWRRLMLSVGPTTLRLAEVWQTAGPADGMTRESVGLGYILVAPVQPSARDRELYIGKNGGDPYILFKSFDTRKGYLVALPGTGGFFAVGGPNIASKKRSGIAITKPAGTVISRGPRPGAIAPARPVRFRMQVR
jgi:hypothetical protein